MASRSRARTRLHDVDVDALLADYDAGVTVNAICAAHSVGLSRLYRILDENHVARRKPSQTKIPLDVQSAIVAEYAEGAPVASIAERHGVSTSTVSDVARRFWRHRQPTRERDELIGLIVRWVMGERLDRDDLEAVARVGVDFAAQGLATIEKVDDELRQEVARRVATEIERRWR